MTIDRGLIDTVLLGAYGTDKKSEVLQTEVLRSLSHLT